MVNRNLLRGLDVDEQEWESELSLALEGTDPDAIYSEGGDVNLNQIVEGKVLRVEGENVLIDVGYKSEGMIPLSEWEEGEEPPQVGQTLKVLIEEMEDMQGVMEDATGMINLSKRKAQKIAAWQEVMSNIHEGDPVTGQVTR